MIASGASFCIAGASISLAFVGCGAPPSTPIIWAGRNEAAKSDTEEVFRLKEKVSKLEEKVPILEDENASLKEEIVCQKTQVSNLTEENAKHSEEIEKLRLQVQQSSPPTTADSQPQSGLRLLDESQIAGLEHGEEVGSGGCSCACKVYSKVAYALKEMKVSETAQQNLAHFIGECELLCMLDHPNIVKAFGIFMGNTIQSPCILLNEAVLKKKSLSRVDLVVALYQVAEGMKYISSRGIVHREAIEHSARK